MNICFDNQREFIISAFRYYRSRTQCSISYVFYHSDKLIHWLYKLGRDYNVLNMDYTQFRMILRGEHRDYYYGRYFKRRPGRYWYCSHYSHFCDPEWYRRLRGFTFNGNSKKDNSSKKDWWEYKGILKDRRKPYRRHHWKKSLKYYGKRKHRRLEHKAIKSERYDKLHRLTYKYAENPWSWD